jgi:molecular chaperone GrpE (heat shock protein)
MANWLTRLLSPRRAEDTAAQAVVRAEDLLRLENEAQALRIELEARDQELAHLKQEVERLRTRQDHLVSETLNAQLEALFGDLAAPASQIMTQADLLETQGKPVQARDVLSVARRLVRAAERRGMLFDGRVGEQAAFDPNRHTPLNSDIALQTGQPVTLRFVGVTFQGKIIHKAIVE